MNGTYIYNILLLMLLVSSPLIIFLISFFSFKLIGKDLWVLKKIRDFCFYILKIISNILIGNHEYFENTHKDMNNYFQNNKFQK